MPLLTARPLTGRDPLIAFVVFASAAAMACVHSSDGDLGFHLATGREVLATGSIPATNVLSYTQPDYPWLLHQWLPAVLFELAWRGAGIAGVTLLKMSVVGLTWSVVYAAARVLGATLTTAGFASLWAAAASSFRFEARPYVFTHLTLALTMLAVAWYVAAARAGESARARMAVLGFAALVAVAAAHLHAGAVDSFLVMTLFALGIFAEPLRARAFGVAPQAPSTCDHGPAWLASVLAAALLAALSVGAYHPQGARILLFPFDMGTDGYLARHLIEFRPPSRFPFWMLCGYWSWLAVALMVCAARAKRLHLGLIAALVGYAVLSLKFARMAYAFGVVSAPVVAVASSQWRLARARIRVRPAISSAALIALGLASPLYVYRDHRPGWGFEPATWPLGHFAFMRDHDLQGNAYLSDAWAGPLLGFFYPSRKVFFDNRMEAYPRDFLRDVYQRIRYAQQGWDHLLDRYHVEIVLMRYTSEGERALQHGQPNLRQRLARDARFSLIRFDDEGELFVRTGGLNARIAVTHGIPCVDPDQRSFVRPPASCAAAMTHALLDNHSTTLLALGAVAALDAGDAEVAVQRIDDAVRRDPADAWIEATRQSIRRARVPR